MRRRGSHRRWVFLRSWLAICLLIVSLCGISSRSEAEEALPTIIPDIPMVVETHAERLAAVESDKGALELFVSTIGPALQLNDVAATLGANTLPAKLAKELLLPDITITVEHLMADLIAWELAAGVRQALHKRQLALISGRSGITPARHEWMKRQAGTTGWIGSLNALVGMLPKSEGTSDDQNQPSDGDLASLSDRAASLEIDAVHATYQEWARLRGWKDRIRRLRGQVRLCGTWQWTIHNHQRHQEQKLSLIFPPPGSAIAPLPGLVETIVLGDNVYLRWEVDGRVQEDSLQFVKDGHRVEGTFVNSQGGWGSISGKRTASCTP